MNASHTIQTNPADLDTYTGTRAVSLLGYLMIAVFLGGFGLWSATVPLASAVIVPGVVQVSGSNLEIQHLEGGLVEQVHVAEGDFVPAGSPIMTLDGTAIHARLNSHTNQLIALRARRSRLIAQRDGTREIVFNDDLQSRAEHLGLTHLLREQRDEFDAELSVQDANRIILRQRVAALQQSLIGHASQLEALSEQRELIAEEAERKHDLLVQGLATRDDYTALMRTLAELVGEIGSLNSTMDRARSGIIEAQEELTRSEMDHLARVTAEISDLSIEQARLQEQMVIERHKVQRLTITAPTDGVVLRLPHGSVGSVFGAGAVAAELLPTNSNLVVETRLEPGDIDVVHEGQDAQLRLVALNVRSAPPVPAMVEFISADRLRDETTGQEYFAARIAIAGTLPAEIDAAELYPGMPTEIVIPVEGRTFLDYLLQPITDSMRHAFRQT